MQLLSTPPSSPHLRNSPARKCWRVVYPMPPYLFPGEETVIPSSRHFSERTHHYVRIGSKGDIPVPLAHFRFTLESRHRLFISTRPSRAALHHRWVHHRLVHDTRVHHTPVHYRRAHDT